MAILKRAADTPPPLFKDLMSYTGVLLVVFVGAAAFFALGWVVCDLMLKAIR